MQPVQQGYADIGYVTTPPGPSMNVATTAGSQQSVLANAQGPGNIGVEAGRFDLSAGSAGSVTLNSIDLTASGTGNDSTAFSEVQIYQDSTTGTVGSYDSADTAVAASAGNFSTDNGTITFNVLAALQNFAASETRTFFVVVKLNGSAQANNTFSFTVSDIDVGSAGKNVSTTTMIGLIVVEPVLTVTPTAGTQQPAYSNAQGTGNAGIDAGRFQIGTNSVGAMTLSTIDLTASGTGNDATAYSEIDVYRDDGSNTYDSADSSILAAPVTFGSDNGTVTLNVIAGEQSFPASTTRLYFIVVKLAGTAQPGQTFQYAISDVTVSGGGKSVPATTMAGLLIATPQFTFTDASATTAATAFLGSGDNVCQEFSVSYPNGPDDKPLTIEVTGLGTADESIDLSAVVLWLDSDASGDFDSALDTQVDSQNYAADDGTVTFDTSSLADFAAGDVRTYFVVYTLNTNASDGETFRCYVSAAAGMTHGGMPNGLPLPATTGTAGLVVSDNALSVVANGPTTALDVDNDSQGTTGDGELLYDVSISAGTAGAWTVTSLTFTASGTGNANTAFSEVALYEDNGNGTWDGAATDTLAAATAAGFTGGSVSFTLTNSAFTAGSTRRFFVTVKLNGSAVTGETFNASLSNVATTPPPGGVVVGVPASASTALVIDLASLTVSAAPGQPSPATHNAGSVADYVIAKFRAAAMNDVVDVSGVTLTTAGTGDWTTDVDGTNGVQIYQDNGDGTFSAAGDTLLYEGAGGATVNGVFTSTVSVQPQTSEDLWVRIRLTTTAGNGQVAGAETFTVSIAATTDVNCSANVVFGTPAPGGITISAIEFTVTNFTPLSDDGSGGRSITITGTGFVSPFSVRINGVPCTGTAVITGGTQVTGLTVPPGSGVNVPIEITSGSLAPQTITQTFSYSTVSGGGGGGDGGGGCVVSDNHSNWLLGFLAMFATAGLALWRRRSQQAR